MVFFKSVLRILLTSLVLTSCALTSHYTSFGKIFHENDTFKNQQRSFVRFVFDAMPLTAAFSNRKYMQVEFLKIKKADTLGFFMDLSMRLNIDQKIDSNFFLKTDTQVVEMSFKDIEYHKFHKSTTDRSTETTTTHQKDKDKETVDKKIIQTTIYTEKTNEYDYNKVKTEQVQLNASLTESILQTKGLLLRYYIDEQAHSHHFTVKELDTIKILINSKFTM